MNSKVTHVQKQSKLDYVPVSANRFQVLSELTSSYADVTQNKKNTLVHVH